MGEEGRGEGGMEKMQIEKEKGKMIASIHHEETCIFQTQSHNKGIGSIHA